MEPAIAALDKIPSHIMAEAYRYADRAGATAEDMPQILGALCHREFMRNTDYLRQMQVAMVTGFSATRFVLTPEGLKAEPIEYPEIVQNNLAALDELIANEAQQLGLA